MSDADRNRRQYFRYRYPIGDRPSLLLGQNFDVVEISEGGLRVARATRDLWLLDGHLKGELQFSDGEVSSIEGRVLRVESGEVVIQLSEGVTFKRMLLEQTRARRNKRLEPRRLAVG